MKHVSLGTLSVWRVTCLVFLLRKAKKITDDNEWPSSSFVILLRWGEFLDEDISWWDVLWPLQCRAKKRNFILNKENVLTTLTPLHNFRNDLEGERGWTYWLYNYLKISIHAVLGVHLLEYHTQLHKMDWTTMLVFDCTSYYRVIKKNSVKVRLICLHTLSCKVIKTE